MEEAIIKVADLILLKMPTETPLNISGFMSSNILSGQADITPPDVYAEMVKIAQSRTSAIREFLLSQKYVETTDYTIQRDKMTDKGKQARKLGGHKQYLEWEAEQQRIYRGSFTESFLRPDQDQCGKPGTGKCHIHTY